MSTRKGQFTVEKISSDSEVHRETEKEKAADHVRDKVSCSLGIENLCISEAQRQP